MFKKTQQCHDRVLNNAGQNTVHPTSWLLITNLHLPILIINYFYLFMSIFFCLSQKITNLPIRSKNGNISINALPTSHKIMQKFLSG